jgi:CRP-like cAMP-binding protein
MLARERRRQNRHISLRGRRNAEERIAGLLAVCPAISIVWLPDGGARLVPLVPHRDLAGLAGVTPQHFSRLLAAWERAGMLHRSPAGWIVPAGTRLLEVIQVGAVSACAPFDDLNIGSGVA